MRIAPACHEERRESRIPLSLALYPLAAFSVIWVALYFAESRLQEKIDLQKMSIDITNQQIDFARQAVKQEWERALSFYINQERENIMPTFEILTPAPKFYRCKISAGMTKAFILTPPLI